MNLKKSLKSQGARKNRSGQSTFEYVVLFAAVTSVAVAIFGGFVSTLRSSGENYFSKAAASIIGGE
jgi:hypothetical protein